MGRARFKGGGGGELKSSKTDWYRDLDDLNRGLWSESGGGGGEERERGRNFKRRWEKERKNERADEG
jgi:hypothetical protein